MPLFYEDSLGAKLSKKWNELGSADDELIEDPAALQAAQNAVDGVDPAQARDAIADTPLQPPAAPWPPESKPWSQNPRVVIWMLILFIAVSSLVAFYVGLLGAVLNR